MATTYKYDHQRSRHIARHILIVLGISLVVVGVVTGVFIWSTHQRSSTIHGQAAEVAQNTTPQSRLLIDEPTYTMELPGDWRQTGSQNTPGVHDVSWQATIKNADNRYLTIYTDTIPATYPVNRELPLTVSGNQLSYGVLSDNCSNFTPGGTTDVVQAEKLKPSPSVWQGVNFICNFPQVIDNQIGTGSAAGVNTVTVTGPKAGTHSYFFLYIDRNINPDYTILENAIQSFKAK